MSNDNTKKKMISGADIAAAMQRRAGLLAFEADMALAIKNKLGWNLLDAHGRPTVILSSEDALVARGGALAAVTKARMILDAELKNLNINPNIPTPKLAQVKAAAKKRRKGK